MPGQAGAEEAVVQLSVPESLLAAKPGAQPPRLHFRAVEHARGISDVPLQNGGFIGCPGTHVVPRLAR